MKKMGQFCEDASASKAKKISLSGSRPVVLNVYWDDYKSVGSTRTKLDIGEYGYHDYPEVEENFEFSNQEECRVIVEQAVKRFSEVVSKENQW